jgi:hypothetical protein
MNVQTTVLMKEECILKNNNKLCPFKKLSVFYKSCLETFGSHPVIQVRFRIEGDHAMAQTGLSPHTSGLKAKSEIS